jgi:glycosyltransferase involved in cell wall biosynthesis
VRILQLLSSTGFHGAESMTAELVKKLSTLGVSVDVAVLDNRGLGDQEIFEHLAGHADAVYRLPCARQLDLQTVLALRRRMIDRQIDLIHSHKYKTTFYAALLRPWRRFGLLTTYHNWITHTRALRTYATIDKSLARFNDRAVGVSTAVVDELRAYVPARRLAQVDNGIDTDVFCPAPAGDPGIRASLCADPARPLIGFVGRLSAEKGLPHLLEALCHPALTDVQAVIVGEGDQRALLEASVAARGLGSRVRLVGHRRDTLAIYRAIDLLALPSLTEAFPMVLLEAMACTKPVLASNVGEVARMVDNGRTGRVVEPGQADALALALAAVLAEPARGAALGQAARQDVMTKFSSDAMARRYVDLYRQSLQG